MGASSNNSSNVPIGLELGDVALDLGGPQPDSERRDRGVGCGWAEMTKFFMKQNSTPSDRNRPRGHLGCTGGCLEYIRVELRCKEWL
jgi:hypothetical protein